MDGKAGIIGMVGAALFAGEEGESSAVSRYKLQQVRGLGGRSGCLVAGASARAGRVAQAAARVCARTEDARTVMLASCQATGG